MVVHRSEGAESCAVHRRVEGTEVLDDLVEGPLDLLFTRDINMLRQASVVPNSDATSARSFSLRSAMAMLAPSDTKTSAVRRPMPDAPPVMNATLPSRRPLICYPGSNPHAESAQTYLAQVGSDVQISRGIVRTYQRR
jgi:hypothetical protein